jgi:molybdopterin-binding protein
LLVCAPCRIPRLSGIRNPAIFPEPTLYSEFADPHKETDMRISARNQIKGKIVDVTKGATTSHVRVDVGGGQIVTSAITNEAVEELGLKKGDNVLAVIKASDVMIAVN